LSEEKCVCPNCGYCPHCGRGAIKTVPFPTVPNYPLYPTYPNPWYTGPVWVWYPQNGYSYIQNTTPVYTNNRKRRLAMSTPALALCGASLPATAPEMLSLLLEARKIIKSTPQVELPTEHVIHAGMYARTVRMPAGTILAGALIKVPTMVIVNGHTKVFVKDGVSEIDGFNVFPASANRMQIFVAVTPVEITMMFPTQAKTVEECEREFTDEHEQLLSHFQDSSKVVITGE
jgi:hypothetical protein